MQNCHAVPDKGSSHIVWTHQLSRLGSCASHRPVSHYVGKYASESETEHKMQELSFQGNLAHERKPLSQPRSAVQYPNNAEQKNSQHDTRNIHEPLKLGVILHNFQVRQFPAYSSAEYPAQHLPGLSSNPEHLVHVDLSTSTSLLSNHNCHGTGELHTTEPCC